MPASTVRLSALLFLIVAFGPAPIAAASSEPARAVAVMQARHGFVEWTPLVVAEGIEVRVAGPDGLVRAYRFAPGETPIVALLAEDGSPLPDGTYTWELRLQVPGSPQLQKAIDAARGRGDEDKRRELERLVAPFVQSGHFTIVAGGVVDPGALEGAAQPGQVVAKDQTVPDDLIVDGKGCIGLACVVNEGFSAEALRLKQSVAWLRFEDTSSAAGFPARDWQLTVNDQASGGADKFSIEDLTAAKTPFTILGNAPTNSLFVDAAGKVGFGTSTPAQSVHVAAGSTPALRLEQTGGTPRTWDVEASGASFALRDVTGSATPLSVAAGAPSNSLYVTATGRLGAGTAAPSTQLQVYGTDAATKILVHNDNSTVGSRELFEIRNKGLVAFIVEDTSVPERWAFSGSASFVINNQATGPVEFSITNTGNGIFAGSVTATGFNVSSSRELKESFSPVDEKAVLTRLATLPITQWVFKDDAGRTPHIGPTAEDFQSTFGLGQNGKGLNLTDVNGVALAAIQALYAEIQEQERRMAEQGRLIDEQRALIEGLRLRAEGVRSDAQ